MKDIGGCKTIRCGTIDDYRLLWVVENIRFSLAVWADHMTALGGMVSPIVTATRIWGDVVLVLYKVPLTEVCSFLTVFAGKRAFSNGSP